MVTVCDELIQQCTETHLKHSISISRGTQGMEECVHPSDCLYSRGKSFINLERLVLLEGRRFGFFPSRKPGVPLATGVQQKCAEGDGHFCVQQLCHPCQQSHVMSFCVIIGKM